VLINFSLLFIVYNLHKVLQLRGRLSVGFPINHPTFSAWLLNAGPSLRKKDNHNVKVKWVWINSPERCDPER
jgi:hypothetical protein